MITNKNIIKLSQAFFDNKEKHLFTEVLRMSNNPNALHAVERVIRSNSPRIYEKVLKEVDDESKVNEFLAYDCKVGGNLFNIFLDINCFDRSKKRGRFALRLDKIDRAISINKLNTYRRLSYMGFLADTINSVIFLKKHQDDYFKVLTEYCISQHDFSNLFNEDSLIKLFGFNFITKENKIKLFEAFTDDVEVITNTYSQYNYYPYKNLFRLMNNFGVLENLSKTVKEIFTDSVDNSDYEFFTLEGLESSCTDIFIKKFDMDPFMILCNTLSVSCRGMGDSESKKYIYEKTIRFSKAHYVDLKRVLIKVKIDNPNSENINWLIKKCFPDLYENLVLM